MIENVQHDYFIWEEKNSTEQKTKLENNGVNEEAVITNEIKNDSTQKDWRDITDPKLRRKAYQKAYSKDYRKVNKEKLKVKDKTYREDNKDSIKNKQKAWRESNKDKIKNYREINKDKASIYNKEYRNKNKLNKSKTKNKKKLSDEEIKHSKEIQKIRKREYAKAFYYQNREEILSYQKNYNKTNKDKRKLWLKSNKDNLKSKQKEYNRLNKHKRNEYSKNKTKTDVQFKLRKNLRKRLWSAINNNQKVGSAVKDLGCTIPELKNYLESKFLPGMSWDNWKHDGWHIDHIKPLASFDLTDRQQFLEACHYTNLQPLWAIDNFIKNDKIDIL